MMGEPLNDSARPVGAGVARVVVPGILIRSSVSVNRSCRSKTGGRFGRVPGSKGDAEHFAATSFLTYLHLY
jgi:hypothetical protein